MQIINTDHFQYTRIEIKNVFYKDIYKYIYIYKVYRFGILKCFGFCWWIYFPEYFPLSPVLGLDRRIPITQITF